MGPRATAPQRQSVWPPHIENRAEPKPAPKAAANSNVLGVWKNGVFRFNSPEAKETWDRWAYQQGVGADTWQHGEEIDDETRDLALANIGGATPPMYRGPDGKYRFGNIRTIERAEVRNHRLEHFQGKTMDQIAAAKMPGEDEYMAKRTAQQQAQVPSKPKDISVQMPLLAAQAQRPVNDNVANTKSAAKALLQDSVSMKVAAHPAETSKDTAQGDAGPGQAWVGRFGPMKEALNSANNQDADDMARIATNSVLGNYGDEVRAAFGAAGAMWNGKSFGEFYDSGLQRERAESLAAQERQGLKGTAAEVITSFIPIVGDASGALADFKNWREHGDDWGWSDYGLVALGLVPGMPNRKATKGAIKIGEGLLDTATEVEDEVADPSKKASKANEAAELAKVNYKALLEEAKSRVYLEGDARKLDRSARGIIYVKEKAGGPEAAKEFMKTHPDVIYDAENDMFHVPAICYDNPNPNGYPFIKLDAASVFGDNTELVLTDVKTKMAIWSEETQNKARGTLGRLQTALKQNPGIKIHYQFKTSKAAEAAQHFLEANDFADIVFVTVREQ